MQRIDGAGHVGHMFVHEDVALGRPPTEVTDRWLNSVQEELCSAIEGSGLALDNLQNNQLLQAIQRLIAASSGSPGEGGLPPGAIMGFGRVTAPPGWLVADGTAVSRTTYAALFDAIGTTWGAGDGATTFNLPSAHGVFLRGADLGRGLDEGRTVGSSQTDQTRSHSHGATSATAGGHSHTATAAQSASATNNGIQLVPSVENSGSYGVAGASTHTHTVTVDAAAGHQHTITVQNTGGNETRPVNIAVLYCIKT